MGPEVNPVERLQEEYKSWRKLHPEVPSFIPCLSFGEGYIERFAP